MTALANALNALFDLLCAPFGGAAEWAVAALSLLLGALMLVLFKAATDQEALVAARRLVTGRVYEMGLYQDHLGVLARIQRDLLAANLRYLRRSLPALLVMALPLVLFLAQVEARYGRRPLAVGERALVTVQLAPADAALLEGVGLEAPAGVSVETAPVRDRRAGTATWRVRAAAPGRHEVRVVLADGRTAAKDVPVGGGAPRLAAVRERESVRRLLLNPAEPPLPADQPVAAVALSLPERRLAYGPWRVHWLVALGVFSLAGGLALKDLFRVRF